MRSIVKEKKSHTKKQRRNQIIVGVVLVVLMFLSIAGFAFQGSEEDGSGDTISYNGQEFVKQNNLWFTQKGDNLFSILTHPDDIPEINNSIDKLNKYQNKVLYLNSNNPQATGEVYRNIISFTTRWQEACIENHIEEYVCEENWPIKNCEDERIIVIKTSSDLEEIEVMQEGKCLFISGNETEIVKAVDSTILEIIGV